MKAFVRKFPFWHELVLVALLIAVIVYAYFASPGFLSRENQLVAASQAWELAILTLPMTLIIILVAPIAGKASDRYGSRWLMTIGMLLLGIQLLYLSQL